MYDISLELLMNDDSMYFSISACKFACITRAVDDSMYFSFSACKFAYSILFCTANLNKKEKRSIVPHRQVHGSILIEDTSPLEIIIIIMNL